MQHLQPAVFLTRYGARFIINLPYLHTMEVKQYELAIELARGGEWLCDVTEYIENDIRRYEIEIDPPIFVDGEKAESFPMEMRYAPGGELVFHTEHPLTEDLQELEGILAREIINEDV